MPRSVFSFMMMSSTMARSEASSIETGSSATIRQARLQQEGTRQHNALPLSAAELVRVFAQDLVGPQPHHFEALLHELLRLILAPSQMELGDDNTENAIHLVERIVNRVGVLEDCLHLPPVLEPVPSRHPGDVSAPAMVVIAAGSCGWVNEKSSNATVMRFRTTPLA
jgi:hypothetical protein